jgi:hypothetical protein
VVDNFEYEPPEGDHENLDLKRSSSEKLIRDEGGLSPGNFLDESGFDLRNLPKLNAPPHFTGETEHSKKPGDQKMA